MPIPYPWPVARAKKRELTASELRQALRSVRRELKSAKHENEALQSEVARLREPPDASCPLCGYGFKLGQVSP